MNWRLNLHVFITLLFEELKILPQTIKDKMINMFVYSMAWVIMNAYIMTKMGLPSNYGPFFLVGIAASVAFFEATMNVYRFLSDLEGDRTIAYELTLPLPAWMVFVKNALVYAANAGAVAFMIIPLGKLILWNNFHLAQIAIGKAILFYLLMNVFFGFFALGLITLIDKVRKIANLWTRLVLPLVFFGAQQYPWSVVYKASPYIAYAMLLNPLVYVMEGLRAAVLGQEGSLSYWYCVGALVLSTLIIGTIATQRLEQRLDCVR